MNKRLLEIQARKVEIRTLLQGGTEVKLDEIQAELDALGVEERGIQTRADIASKINAGVIIGTPLKKPTDEPEVRANTGESIEYRQAFMAYVLQGKEIPAELRVAANTKTTDIGSMIPMTVLNKIIDKIEATGMILNLVTRTAYKGGVSIPIGSVKPVASWVAEGATSDRQKKSISGNVVFAYNKLRCAVSVSLETDTMALSSFEANLISNVSEAMTKAIEQSIISGSGVGVPKGILTEVPAAGQAITGTPKNAKLIEAEGALPLEYENNAVYVMTKKTFMSFVGEVDSAGQPIARVNSGITGRPERTLLGRTVVLCNYIATYATGLAVGTPWAFLFDFGDYVLNTNYNITVKKYEDNETDDQVTKSIMLVDGKVIDINSLVTLIR